MIFSSDTRSEYKIGVFPVQPENIIIQQLEIPEKLKTYKYIKFVPFADFEQGLDRLRHHKIDILLKNSRATPSYWISDTSPKGYLMEKVVKESMIPEEVFKGKIKKEEIKGKQIRYLDWLFPGILGMNIMFSSLFGVGYIIVRYRRSGVLKRLKATPVTPFEYLTANWCPGW